MARSDAADIDVDALIMSTDPESPRVPLPGFNPWKLRPITPPLPKQWIGKPLRQRVREKVANEHD